MSVALNALRSRYDRIAISTIQVAFALSLLLHGALLSGWLPEVTLRPSEKPGEGKPGGSLAVRLAPPPAAVPAPPPAPMTQARSQPRPGAPAPAAATPDAQRRPPSAEARLALERPSASRATAPSADTAPAPPSADTDFAASIEARRRARESASAPPPSRTAPPVPPAETPRERDNRIAAINLGLNRTPSFGDEKKHGGGIFQVARLGFNDAEFFFFGWNKAIQRNARQMIEVQRGANASTEIAVVRRMIAIIREHEQGDFVWESRRLGRDVRLSARLADNAGLEEFMMHEFFAGARAR